MSVKVIETTVKHSCVHEHVQRAREFALDRKAFISEKLLSVKRFFNSGQIRTLKKWQIDIKKSD